MHSRIRRLGAALLGALMASGLLVAGHHQATALHGFCSEHGQQIHLDHPSPRLLWGAPVGQGSIERPIHAHGAHFCEALAFLGQSSEQPLAAPEAKRAGPAASELCLVQGRQVASIRLLRQAPKHSPPGC